MFSFNFSRNKVLHRHVLFILLPSLPRSNYLEIDINFIDLTKSQYSSILSRDHETIEGANRA